MTGALAVHAAGVGFRYGDRVACDDIGLEVEPGAVHGVLGPNGSGKSTLFKVLCTAYPIQRGTVSVFGEDLATRVDAIRSMLGVVFQSAALDGQLTVEENLICAGNLFGLRGGPLRARVAEVAEWAGVRDRAADRVAALSGGLRRRVEIAKALLPAPRLLLLDEPSTGLDPGARIDLWRLLRASAGLTVLFTTHLMDEAEQADGITILTEGRVVAAGRPADLVQEVGGVVLEASCEEPEAVAARVEEVLGVAPVIVGRALRVESPDAHRMVGPLVDALGSRLARVSVSHASLEDVYIRKTGHRFWTAEDAR